MDAVIDFIVLFVAVSLLVATGCSLLLGVYGQVRIRTLLGGPGAGTVDPLVALVLAGGVFALLILLGVFS